MSRSKEASSSRSNSSDHAFPFQQHDSTNHPTLLPNGILNDDEDEVVPWPRRASKSEGTESTPILKVRRLPQDLTTREFAALFTFADGFLESDLVNEADEVSRSLLNHQSRNCLLTKAQRVGIAKFMTYSDADKAKQKMSSVSAGPYSQLSFEIIIKRGSQDLLTPPAALSSSSKSNGSNNGSMPQISRLASYVKEKSSDSQIGLNDFYGNGSNAPKSAGLSGSMPTNFSTSAGTTVWSPTSPRFTIDLGKSPPTGLSMLPPPIKEDASWNRSASSNNNGNGSINNARFSQLSINTSMPTQDARLQTQQSPTMSAHQPSTPMYASIDNSLHLGMSNPAYQGPGAPNPLFQASPPKQYMTSPGLGPSYGGHNNYNGRMGASAPINTNPADQNPPCNTLYVGNLPLATTEEELKSLFSRQPGYRRLCYRTKSNGPMCFVEFEDVHYAINSLKLLQGVILSSSIKGGIRLSFSKNPLGVRKMDGNQLMPNQGAMPTSSNIHGYNAMHAPPGLQPGQVNGHSQPQTSGNPIWR